MSEFQYLSHWKQGEPSVSFCIVKYYRYFFDPIYGIIKANRSSAETKTMNYLENLRNAVNAYVDAKERRKLEYKVRNIVTERKELEHWTDTELQLATQAFRQDLQKGKRLDTLTVPAFAVVNEVARRLLGQSPYEVQILGGLVIHSGKVAEMKAGEGKTLTETMPVYLNALAGYGVHLITTNDYLAERDAKWMGKLYNFLGLTVGYVTSTMKNEERRKAYACDITYVTNQEIGFDFLRDNLVYSRSDRVLRPEHPLFFGIVDEIDSILIDESRTPLIIAEPTKDERNLYDQFTEVASLLEENKDYTVDYKNKYVAMTNEGLDRVEQILGAPLFSKDNPMYVFYLDVCLKAKVVFERDRDYIITKGGVEIVDEFTGRVLPGRRFTDGVHQAIEAKEKVKVKGSDRTAATITFQNFFPIYEKLSGMSGTVMDARKEFNEVYNLDVIQIPTNKPVIRVDHNDLFFKTQKGKFEGMVKKIHQITKQGQPLLIGARNVEIAHTIAEILEKENLPFQLLTASDNRAEAEKIAKAGQEGLITVATNMAGRGTDILLGQGVEDLGGLFVLGTERHESRRIDGQLIGRAGRQGEPGESQFLISMEDEIIQLFASEKIIDVMEEYDIPEDEYISGKGLDEAFKRAQDFIESKNYDSRIYLYKYDRVVNYQRDQLYKLRDRLLGNEPAFRQFLQDTTGEVVRSIFELKDSNIIKSELKTIFNIDVTEKEMAEVLRAKNPEYHQEVVRHFIDYLTKAEQPLVQRPEIYDAAQKLILEIIDNNWGTHLELMDILKEEANLFSYASVDPLIDFIKDGNELFQHMGTEIQRQFLKAIFFYISQQ